MAAIEGVPGERVTVREECRIYMLRSGVIAKKTARQESVYRNKKEVVVVLLDGEKHTLPFLRDELRKEEPK